MQPAEALEEIGLGFIGVVKQTLRQYPMGHLQRKEFNCRGDCYSLVSVDEGVTEMVTFAWVDRNRR